MNPFDGEVHGWFNSGSSIKHTGRRVGGCRCDDQQFSGSGGRYRRYSLAELASVDVRPLARLTALAS